MPYKLDTDTQIFFYEQEFYCLSNFSAFRIAWRGIIFDTVEHAYHCEKFPNNPEILKKVYNAPSAHDSLQIAKEFKDFRRYDWDEVKVSTMEHLLRAKISQHPYVLEKLRQTNTRELIEDSWRDDFWGWGENKTGQNQLGKLWMKIREEIR